MLQELARQTGQDPADVLRSTGPSATQLRENLRMEASERVRRSLVMEKLATAESIEVADADVDAELARVGGDGPKAEQVRAMFDNENGRAMLRRNLLNAQIMDRLSEIARANALAGSADDDPAPDPDEPENADIDADAGSAGENAE